MFSNGFGNNSCLWIILILIIIFCCCGDGCGDGRFERRDGRFEEERCC